MFTSDKEVISLTVCICVFVCKRYGHILMKFSGNVDNGTRNRYFDFGGDPHHCLDQGFLNYFFIIALSNIRSVGYWWSDV